MFQLQNPLDGCFFCDPEEWRTIARFPQTQILAGAGPLVPGYVLIASREHIPSSADLPHAVRREFEAAYNLVLRAFRARFAHGYTAYEHGRIGSCRVLEAAHDYSTFCHHAHRAVMPVAVDCADDIAPHFEDEHQLPSIEQLRDFTTQEYVFYEMSNGRRLQRHAYTRHKGIPSQFMRRVISRHLANGRDWNWAADLRCEEMALTTRLLREEFLGIDGNADLAEEHAPRRLRGNISLDGLSNVGKTSLARAVARATGAAIVDTGLYFRFTAATGEAPETLSDQLLDLLTSPTPAKLCLYRSAATRNTAAAASDMEVRRRYRMVIGELAERLRPCILIGRDSWRFLRPGEPAFLLEADFESRVRRRYLQIALADDALPDLDQVSTHLAALDDRDHARLPSSSIVERKLWNGRRRFADLFAELLTAVVPA